MWDLFSIIILLAGTAISIIGIFVSLYLLVQNQPPVGRMISLKSFAVLLVAYATVMTAFGILYLSLELLGFQVLVEEVTAVHTSFFHLLEDVMYFSAVTLLTVGYGDITPQGIGRWIAMVEALIGYLLPAAFVVTTAFYRARQMDRL